MSTLYVNTINPQSGSRVHVQSNLSVSGNLLVSGTLHARSTDFIISANSVTLGDASEDTVTINASTATIPNNLTFSGGTLASTGDVSGSARGIFVTGLTTAGPLNVSGTATVSGEIEVAQDITTEANLNAGTGVYITGGDVSGSARGIFVTGLTTAGPLNVTGAATLAGGATVTGQVTAAAVSSSGPGVFVGGLTTGGNLNVSGTLTQTGSATIGIFDAGASGVFKALQVTPGSAMAAAAVSTSGTLFLNDSIGGTGNALKVHSGNSEFKNGYFVGDVSGSARGIFVTGLTTAGALNVTGAATFVGDIEAQVLDVEGAFTAESTATLAGGATVTGDVSGSARGIFVTGLTTAGALNVTGAATVVGATTITGDTSVGGYFSLAAGGMAGPNTLAFTGNSTFTGEVSGSARGIFLTGLTTAGALNVTGAATLAGGATVKDDQLLYFGNDSDASIKYDADDNDRLEIVGAAGGTGFSGGGITFSGGQFSVSSSISFEVHHTGSKSGARVAVGSGGGEVIYYGTGSTTAGYLYYLNHHGGWIKTNAKATGSYGTSGAGQASQLAIAMGTNPLDNGMLIRGFYHLPTVIFQGSYLTGSAVYINSGSTSHGGEFTCTAPTAGDSYVRIVGYCTVHPKVIHFDPDKTWVEVS